MRAIQVHGYGETADAAALTDVDAPQPPAGRAVGSRIAKLDGAAKVTGSELFGADRYPAGVLHVEGSDGWLRSGEEVGETLPAAPVLMVALRWL